MRRALVSDEKQALGEALGAKLLDQAWEWLAADHPDQDPTTYRRVFAAIQLIVSVVPKSDERMALAAIGSVLGAIDTQRPELEVVRQVTCGFLGTKDAEKFQEGTMQ